MVSGNWLGLTELEEANRGFAEAWKYFMERLPMGSYEESNGWIAAIANVPLSFFNLFLVSSPVEDRDSLHRRLLGILQRASRLDHPWFLALCEEWAPDGFDRDCLESGLAPAMRMSAMATDFIKPPRRPLPDLRYRRVSDYETADLIAQINGMAYGMPGEVAQSLAIPQLWDESSYGFIGYKGEQPVTCTATIVTGHHLYVGFVATLPGEQRKGYAEAVMRKSLEEARKATGYSRCLLHATEAGRPVYAAMGFRETAGFTLYSPALRL